MTLKPEMPEVGAGVTFLGLLGLFPPIRGNPLIVSRYLKISGGAVATCCVATGPGVR